MVKKIRTLEEMPVDTVEAVKRGILYRGFIPRKYRRNSQLAAERDSPSSSSGSSEQSGAESSSQRLGAPEDKDTKNSDKSEQESENKGKPKRGKDQEASKDPEEPEPGETHEKLIDLAEKSHDILFTAESVFPFTLFPDTITLDREKLTIANRSFFRVAKIITIPITSLVSAEADVGPFFGSIHMTSKYFLDNTHHLRFLWRHDAEQLHRLLQGYIIAHERGIDVTEVDKDDVKVLLEDLGHGT